MAIKPFDINDLREILTHGQSGEIDALSDESWVEEASEEELATLIERGTEPLRLQIGQNTRSLRVIMAFARDSEDGLREAVAENPNTPAPILVHLAKDSHPGTRVAALMNPNLPDSSLQEPAAQGDPDEQRALAFRAGLPVPLQERLVRSPDPQCRALLAANGGTDPSVLLQLVDDPSEEVWPALLLNPKLSLAVQEKLAGNRDSKRRAYLARHARTPLQLLERLAGDEAKEVLIALHGNPAAPEILRKQVLHSVAAREDTWEIRAGVAASADAPPDLLARLAHDPAPEVRTEIARNANTPGKALECLAGDLDVEVRKEVAGHPNTPAEALAKLAGDNDFLVREKVAENIHTPPPLLAAMAQVEHEEFFVVWGIAKNVSTPIPTLEQLSQRSDVYSYCYVALNKAVPPESLERMFWWGDYKGHLELLKNPRTPLQTIRQIITTWGNNPDHFEEIKSIINTDSHHSLDDILKEDCYPGSIQSSQLPNDSVRTHSDPAKPSPAKAIQGRIKSLHCHFKGLDRLRQISGFINQLLYIPFLMLCLASLLGWVVFIGKIGLSSQGNEAIEAQNYPWLYPLNYTTWHMLVLLAGGWVLKYVLFYILGLFVSMRLEWQTNGSILGHKLAIGTPFKLLGEKSPRGRDIISQVALRSFLDGNSDTCPTKPLIRMGWLRAVAIIYGLATFGYYYGMANFTSGAYFSWGLKAWHPQVAQILDTHPKP